MDTNYAAPRRPAAGVDDPAARSGRVALLRAGFVLALLVQVYLLYFEVPGTSDLPLFPHVDKVVHAAMFALPAAIAVLARLPLWPVVVALAVHAPVSELVQGNLITGRFADPLDMLADWGGIALGLLVGFVVRALWFGPGRPNR